MMWKVQVYGPDVEDYDDDCEYESDRDWEISVVKGVPVDTWGWDDPENKWILYSGGVGGQKWCPKRFEFMKHQAELIAGVLNSMEYKTNV